MQNMPGCSVVVSPLRKSQIDRATSKTSSVMDTLDEDGFETEDDDSSKKENKRRTLKRRSSGKMRTSRPRRKARPNTDNLIEKSLRTKMRRD